MYFIVYAINISLYQKKTKKINTHSLSTLVFIVRKTRLCAVWKKNYLCGRLCEFLLLLFNELNIRKRLAFFCLCVCLYKSEM